MDEAKVIKALRDWSPKGLCDGMLLDTSSGVDKTSTVGCASGCLIMEFLSSDDGVQFLRARSTELLEYAMTDLRDRDTPTTEMEKALEEFYELRADEVQNDLLEIIGYNDNCIINPNVAAFNIVPEAVKEVILELREKWELDHAGRD